MQRSCVQVVCAILLVLAASTSGACGRDEGLVEGTKATRQRLERDLRALSLLDGLEVRRVDRSTALKLCDRSAPAAWEELTIQIDARQFDVMRVPPGARAELGQHSVENFTSWHLILRPLGLTIMHIDRLADDVTKKAKFMLNRYSGLSPDEAERLLKRIGDMSDLALFEGAQELSRASLLGDAVEVTYAVSLLEGIYGTPFRPTDVPRPVYRFDGGGRTVFIAGSEPDIAEASEVTVVLFLGEDHIYTNVICPLSSKYEDAAKASEQRERMQMLVSSAIRCALGEDDMPEAPTIRPTQRTASRAEADSDASATVDAGEEVEAPHADQKACMVDVGDGVTMKLAYIPAGTFVMGSDVKEPDEYFDNDAPAHRVSITHPFYMSVTEVTQAQYAAIMGGNPSKFPGTNNPVEQVSWEDAVAFCKALSKKTGRTFRLPTEAEWEYACRAGSTTRYSFGDDADALSAYAWFEENSDRKTHPVGQKKPNAWGLFDMHGNVWEWCSDWVGEYRNAAVTDPEGPSSGSARILRGGSCVDDARGCRSTYRFCGKPDSRYRTFGLRVLMEVGDR